MLLDSYVPMFCHRLGLVHVMSRLNAVFQSKLQIIRNIPYVNKSNRNLTAITLPGLAPLGPVSRKPRKGFGRVKLFSVHLWLKTEKCVRLKLRV